MAAPVDVANESSEQGLSWVLRLLSGLQQGAEVALRDGIDYVIGHDDGCDLVLWDDSVALRHLLLHADGDSLRLQALDEGLSWPEGRIERGQTVSISSATIVQLGEVLAGLGPPATDWRALPRPTPSRVEQTGALPNKDQGQTTDQAAAAASKELPTAGPQTDTSAPSDRQLLSTSEPKAIKGTPVHRLVATVAILIGLLIAGLILSPWSLFGSRHPHQPASQAPEPRRILEEARALIDALGLAGIELEVQPSGVLTLRGYCPTRAERDLLLSRLLARGWRLDNRLWLEDQLREVLAETLDRLGARGIDYAYLGQGVVRLRGWLRVGLTPDQVGRTVQQDVPGVQRVINELNSLAPLLDDLRAQVRTARLERRLTIDSSGAPPVRVSGQLNEQDMTRWQAIHDALAGRYPQPLPLQVDLARVSVEPPLGDNAAGLMSADPVLVRGILVSPKGTGYALLGDGERVSVGDLIQGRYVVEEIAFDRIVALDGAGERLVFRIGVNQP